MSPYRTPGTGDPPPPPRRWGATRYRKWMYKCLQTVLLVMDRTMTITDIVGGGGELRSLEMTKAEERVVIRGILESLSGRRGQ